MPLVHVEFRELFHTMETLSLILESYYLDTHNNNVWCSSDFDLVYQDNKFLDATVEAMKHGYLGEDVSSVHFTPGEPIYEGAPFTLADVELWIDGDLILLVDGQKSARIKAKWEARFSGKCGGRTVTIEWLTQLQR